MAKGIFEENSNNLNIISSGTTIIGDINSEADIRIDGTLNGTIRTSAKLVLGDTGVINGEIFCVTADISGKIEGKIVTEGLLLLKESSKVAADISSSKLSIEQGAEFSGTCKMKGNFEHITSEVILNDLPTEE